MGSASYGFWEVLSLLGVLQGGFLAIVLWTHRRGNRQANRLLAVLVLLFSLHLFHIVLYWTRGLAAMPQFFGAPWFFPYLYGPLLFLYARSLGRLERSLRLPDAAHGLAFVLAVATFARFYLSSSELKRRILEATYEGVGPPNGFALALMGFQFVHFFGYVLATLRATAGPEPRNRWAKRLLLGFAATFSLWFAYGLAVSYGLPYWRVIDYGATLAMTATIYAIGYTALREPEIFVGDLAPQKGSTGAKGKYEKSSLGAAEVDELARRLLGVMDEAKPHTEASLRLDDLAALVGLHQNQLSQVINQRFGQNFNDFVNRYRVDEAKRLLSDPRRMGDSLLSLAFEAGFNNKTSFNEAFKKHAGMTPSQFRASALAER